MSPARKWLPDSGSANPDSARQGSGGARKLKTSFIDLLSTASRQSGPADGHGLPSPVKRTRSNRLIRPSGTLLVAALGVCTATLNVTSVAVAATIDTPSLRFQIIPDTGRYEILDKQADVTWQSNPYQARFGEVTLNVRGQTRRISLDRCDLREAPGSIEATFHPLADTPEAALRLRIRASSDGKSLDLAYDADAALEVESLRLLDEALWVTDADRGYAAVPVRLGLLVPADSGKSFTHRFDTFAYEGCHMEMLGFVKNGAAVLVTWHDPYVAAELRSTVTNAPWLKGRQALSASLVLRKSARSFRIQLLGPGDYVAIAKAYRGVAREKGWLVTWEEKLKTHPEAAQYFGASNYKLWSTLSRRMSEDSTKEERVNVNWTFDEAAQVAEHLKHDLKLEKVLFIMGGWIHRGYDNQHPDILPAAPECGGDAAFADCCRRVRALGFLLSLHDNYQDIYRDSPSWNEDFVMKNPDGGLITGGHWAGGRAYLTCSRKAVELARRPQNLPAVKKLTGANSYFIDTTYAAGLCECFDTNHPLTRWDDMKWKQAISDYAREVFGTFGSECGREWAIPHADFFEGLTGVSGTYYHNKDLIGKLGASVVPLFEIVYRDCVQMYGKYGYDPAQAADYVLHHIAIGRPLNYHVIPPHLYWKAGSPTAPEVVALRPAVVKVTRTDPQRFSITYEWVVEKTPAKDWRVFVHFTDDKGNIKFQNDHDPRVPVSQWSPGVMQQGPFTVTIPDGLTGTFDIRIGLFESPMGPRALLNGAHDGERRVVAGRLKVADDQIAFEPLKRNVARVARDASLFTRADNGWAEGMHLVDRFVKNTHEILSPLNELTSQMRLTRHEFLTTDRNVQRTVFGEGADSVEVIVNAGPSEYQHRSRLGGEVILPPYGFVVESPSFVAFHALEWNGHRYEAPPLFTLRSLDGEPLARSGTVRVFHAFGDTKIKLRNTLRAVAREEVF